MIESNQNEANMQNYCASSAACPANTKVLLFSSICHDTDVIAIFVEHSIASQTHSFTCLVAFRYGKPKQQQNLGMICNTLGPESAEFRSGLQFFWARKYLAVSFFTPLLVAIPLQH